MLELNECIEILKRNTPKAISHLEWMAPYNNPLVLVLFLGYTIPICRSEIDGMVDYEVEALIKRKTLEVFRNAIAQIDPNYFVDGD